MTVASIAWSGIIMALVGFTWDYLSLILVVGLGTLGSAAFHPSGASLASASATSRRGAAISVFSVGGNVGSALSPLWVAVGIGWLGMRGTSVLIPIALLVSLFLYQQLRPPATPQSSPTVARQKALEKWTLVWLVLIVLSMTFRAWFQVTLITYLPTWLQSQGRSLAAGGNLLFLLLASVGVGSLIGGSLSDRIGRWQVLALSMGLLGPAQWLLLNTSDPFQTALLAVMGGLLGATFPVSIAIAQEVWPGGQGLASGLVIGLPWLGGGIGATLTGLVADRSSLTVALLSLVLPVVLGAGCILAYAALSQASDNARKQSPTASI
jgi:FSR family fosmidomycin resistance protein-like MFS transporter